MILKFKQTSEDYINWNFYYVWARPERRNARIFLSALPLLLLIDYSILQSFSWAKCIIPVFDIMAIFLVKPIVKFFTELWTIRILETKATDLLLDKTISFHEELISVRTKLTYLEIKWQAIQHLRETALHFFLFSGSSTIILPKRAFSSTHEMAELKSMMMKNINNPENRDMS